MLKEKSLIKVAFWYDRPVEYSGGLNYIYNLLFALSKSDSKKIQPYIFFGKDVKPEVINRFTGLATVIRTSILDRWSILWLANKILIRLFGSTYIVGSLLSRYGISILSHPDGLYSQRRSFRIISWIPDFQYLHLPDLFPFDTASQNKRILNIVRGSDITIFSSLNALNDYRSIARSDRELSAKVRVLQFVSQPNIRLQNFENPPTSELIEKKFSFKGKYFFLPNQFWRHKNHSVVFSAVNILKKSGINVLLICTGNISDYRFKNNLYFENMKEYIIKNNLNENIKILGLIDYIDVLLLFKNSVAVINPSCFEGWSSTVEEARSMGQRLILSDIPVHREQNPPKSIYFDKNDDIALSKLMAKYWEDAEIKLTKEDELVAAEELIKRTKLYGENYIQIVLEAAGLH